MMQAVVIAYIFVDINEWLVSVDPAGNYSLVVNGVV